MKILNCFFFLILLHSDLHAQIPSNAKDIHYTFFYADLLRLSNNAADALKAINKGVEKYPQVDSFYSLRGKIYIELGSFKDALSDFSKAIYYSKFAKANFYADRGYAKSATKDVEGGMSDFKTAINLDPNCYLAFMLRGGVKVNLEDYRGAIGDLNQAIRINPKDGITYAARGDCKFNLNNFKEAILDCNKSIDLEPEYSRAFYIRGLCYNKLGNIELACSDLSKAGELGYARAYDAIKAYCN